MQDSTFKLRKIIVMKKKIKILSGLRIGGSREEIRIGDIDNPVIRDPITKQPYIPGSSLKGKMRSSLEIALYGADKPCSCGDCVVCKLFGAASGVDKNKKEATRLIVRDSFLTKESMELLLRFVGNYVEIKMENSINRVKGTADNPRTLDRIPAGSEFDCEFVLRLYDKDIEDGKEEEYKKYIKMALDLIKFTYLGGSGTRGYGKVDFDDISEQEHIITVNNGTIEIS